MATSYTYATLVADLKAFIEDDGTDFAAIVDEIISLAEERLLRELNFTIFDTTSEETLSANSAVLTKPAAGVFFRAAWVKDTNDDWIAVEPRSHEFLIDYYQDSGATGEATGNCKYWCDFSPTQLRFAPMKSAAQTIRLTYMAKPTQLSSSNTTTWLSTNLGDLLFTACLIVGSQFSIADERLEMWERTYALQLASALNTFQHLRAPAYALR